MGYILKFKFNDFFNSTMKGTANMVLTLRLPSLFLPTRLTKGGGVAATPPRESNIFVSIWPILVSN